MASDAALAIAYVLVGFVIGVTVAVRWVEGRDDG